MLQELKARRPKSVDKNGIWRSSWVEEQRARDGWCTWRRLLNYLLTPCPEKVDHQRMVRT